MTTAEKHIRHFNRLSGNLVFKKTLQEFLSVVKKCDEPALKELEKKLSEAISKIKGEGAHLSFKPLSVPTINTKKLPKKSKAVKVKMIGAADPELLHGCEHIQNDEQLIGEQLGEVGATTYKVITDKILSLIDKEGLIWRKPWNENHQGKEGLAHNYVTKSYYRGTNYYLNYLLMTDYKSPYFMTFKQVDQKGGKVKAGQKGWPVIYFKYLYKNLKSNKLVEQSEAVEGGMVKAGYDKFPALFYYMVFNSEQCEGLNLKPYKPIKLTQKEKIESCEKIVEGMPQRPPIENVRGDRAFYRPSTDSITMPLMAQFKIDQEYYSTLFHELVHSTGAPSRLDRDLSGSFGSKKYAFEELIAELGASYLCGESGILYFTLDNTAAYIKSWRKKLREEMTADPKFFLKAAAAAEQASEFIQGKKNKVVKSSDSDRESKRSRPPVERKKKRSDRWIPVKDKLPENYSAIEAKLKSPVDEWVEEVGFSNGKFELPGRGYTNFVTHWREIREYPQKKSTGKRPAGVFGVSDIANRPVKQIQIDGRYKEDFNELYSDTQILIWGPPGGGKTSYQLFFAQYLAGKDLNVLYVANEEFKRTTFTKKMKELDIKENPNLHFAPKLPSSLTDYDVIFLDSVQSLGMDLKAYIKFAEDNSGKIIVPIVQSTKEGDFRGGKDWEHEVDIAGEIRNRKLILRKNRLDPDFSVKSDRLWMDELISKKERSHSINQAVKDKVKASPPKQNVPQVTMQII